MLTGSYSTGPSDFTRAIDAALAEWSRYITSDATIRFNLAENNAMPYLARNIPSNSIPIGTMGGREVRIPKAAAALQGYSGDGPDMTLEYNSSFPWHFGPGTEAGKYSADGVMTHETGHGLFMNIFAGDVDNPYTIWKRTQPASDFSDVNHFSSPGTLMKPSVSTATEQHITPDDLEAARASSIPTTGDDLLYLINGSKVDGGGGSDIGVWLDTFDKYNAAPTRVKNLEMRGDNALTQPQQDTYRLYKAAFGRAPDMGGFQYWNGTNKGLGEMAGYFAGSDEFKNKYGGQSHPELVTQMYRNILNRDPDQGGYDYWVNRKDLDAAHLLANFAVSPENVIGTPKFTLEG